MNWLNPARLLFRRLLYTHFAVALLVATAPLSLAGNRELLTTRNVPDQIYFENDGELYMLDLSSFNNATGYASGNGSYTVTMNRLVFTGSSPSHVLVLGGGVRSGLPILGSEDQYVKTILGVDPATRLSEQTALTISVARSGGSSTVTIATSLDSVTTTLPDVMFADDTTTVTGTLTVNGDSAKVTVSDLRQLQAVMNGKRLPEDAAVSHAIKNLSRSMNNGERFNSTVAAFNVVTLNQQLRYPMKPSDTCWLDCVGCTFSGIGYIASWAAIISTGCGGGVGCLVWGAGHGAALSSVALSCSSCTACHAQPGPGEGSTCPVSCDGAACPEGCPCPDGTISGPDGCAEDCDLDTDPDGCECPIGDNCIDSGCDLIFGCI